MPCGIAERITSRNGLGPAAAAPGEGAFHSTTNDPRSSFVDPKGSNKKVGLSEAARITVHTRSVAAIHPTAGLDVLSHANNGRCDIPYVQC
jgi:hypothetical protein